MIVSTKQLANILGVSTRTVQRWTKSFKLPHTFKRREAMYDLTNNHPLFQSILIAAETKVKPIYTTADIAKIMKKSIRAVRKMVLKSSIPFWCSSGDRYNNRRIYIFASDLYKLEQLSRQKM